MTRPTYYIMITEQTSENIFTFGFLDKSIIEDIKSIIEPGNFDIKTRNNRNNINHNNNKIVDLQNIKILVEKIVET